MNPLQVCFLCRSSDISDLVLALAPEPGPEFEPIAEESCIDDHELPYREKVYGADTFAINSQASSLTLVRTKGPQLAHMS